MSESSSPAPRKALPFVQLFTDGACSGNPGPGGWAYILRHPASGTEREVAGGMPDTTNNQMELQALIEGLQALKSRSKVEVVADEVAPSLRWATAEVHKIERSQSGGGNAGGGSNAGGGRPAANEPSTYDGEEPF